MHVYVLLYAHVCVCLSSQCLCIFNNNIGITYITCATVLSIVIAFRSIGTSSSLSDLCKTINMIYSRNCKEPQSNQVKIILFQFNILLQHFVSTALTKPIPISRFEWKFDTYTHSRVRDNFSHAHIAHIECAQFWMRDPCMRDSMCLVFVCTDQQSAWVNFAYTLTYSNTLTRIMPIIISY